MPRKHSKAKTVKLYNVYGQLIQVDEYPWATGPNYYRTKYTYDLQNQIISMTDPRNMALKYEYDYFGVKKVDYPGTLRSDDVYVYDYLDSTKQVRKILSPYERIITEYDELDRVKKIIYPEGRIIKHYYDGIGRLVKTKDYSSAVEYKYDLSGNVKTITHKYDGKIFNINYSYDEKGNVTGITYPSGDTITYEYDNYGRVNRIPGYVESKTYIKVPGDEDEYELNSSPVYSPTYTYVQIGPGVEYESNGFMKKLQYANGITTTFTSDSLGRIQTIQNPILQLTYGYDGKGNVTSITGMNGVPVASTYSYYDNDWLRYARQGQNVYSYAYDAAGNCLTKTINGVQTSYGYDPQSLNLLTTINGQSIQYDARGNIVKRNDTGYDYEYDQSNQLTKVNNGVAGEYFYNGEGKRYKKVENGQSTYYVYSGEILLYELKPNGTLCTTST